MPLNNPTDLASPAAYGTIIPNAVFATTINASATTASTSTTTGAIVTPGGIASGGSLFVGGGVNAISAALRSGSFTGTITPATLNANRAYSFPDASGQVKLNLGDNPLVEMYSHFIEGSGGWATQVNGTGAGISFTAITDTASPGIAQLGTGTTAAGRTAIGLLTTVTNGGGLLPVFRVSGSGSGVSIHTSRIRIPIASDGTDTFIVKMGFLTRSDATESASCVCFRYIVATSANWQIVCRNANAETAVTTSVVAGANTWDNFKIVINNGGTTADFFINGTNVGQITTNIPISTNGVGASVVIGKTLGANIRTIEVDYQYVGVGL